MSPLLAVVEALRDESPDVRFLFVGGRGGFEAELVRLAGLPFHATPLPSLRDPDSRLALARQVGVLPLAAVDVLPVLVRFRASVCLTSGGFGALPAALAARALRVPVYLWEGNALPGRANRALARWAQKVAVTFPGTERHLPGAPTVLTGNPVRPSLLRWTRSAARETLGLPQDGAVVLATGGSQGSAVVNEALLGALPQLLRRAAVVHHTGASHLIGAEERRETLAPDLRALYHPIGFLTDRMGAALASADLVVARAGSSSIAEPLAFGLPMVLVPFAASLGGHQDANARAAEAVGAAVVLREPELSPERLLSAVLAVLDDPARLAAMRDAARRGGRPYAARDIARGLLALGRCA